ncbi:uncharacterized protein A4U43_C10F12440 [Asparagus officinalis]|uniref:Uncharacterized protein n=1 Tax=Asparagus officinalis TaxID=4686 RepID=A0A5P1E2C1_ASPOF|nr:uncharacterized protein A4U43_C10F12440 [Asparagus officinalis]
MQHPGSTRRDPRHQLPNPNSPYSIRLPKEEEPKSRILLADARGPHPLLPQQHLPLLARTASSRHRPRPQSPTPSSSVPTAPRPLSARLIPARPSTTHRESSQRQQARRRRYSSLQLSSCERDCRGLLAPPPPTSGVASICVCGGVPFDCHPLRQNSG